MVSGVSREQSFQSKDPRAARQGRLLAAHRGQFAHRASHLRNHHLLRKRLAHRDRESDVGASFYLHHGVICQGEQAKDCPRDASTDGQRADAEATPCPASLSAEEKGAREKVTPAGRLPKWSDTPMTLAGRLPGLSDTWVTLAGRLPGLSDTPVMLAGRLPGLSDTLVMLAGRLPESSNTPAMLAGRLPENFSRLSPPVSSIFPPYPQCSINPWRSVSFRRLLLPKETASAGSCAGLLQSNYATLFLSKHHANHPCRR